MNYKCILFDLDGTLINTNNLIIESFRHALRTYSGRELHQDEITPHFGEPLITILEHLAPGHGKMLLPIYREYNIQKHDELTTAFPGVYETVKLLHERGITLGVVTSKMKEVAKMGMRLYKLDEVMEILVACEDTTLHKPDPEPILKALELLGIEKSDTIYVGDSTVDILCAKNAGVTSAAVMWSSLGRELLLSTEPDIILETIEDLLKLF